MKKVIILSAAAFLVSLSACNNSSMNNGHSEDSMSHPHEHATEASTQTFNLDTTKLSSGDVFYQCEMHHNVNSDKPGSCPECKMDLSEIKKH